MVNYLNKNWRNTINHWT